MQHVFDIPVLEQKKKSTTAVKWWSLARSHMFLVFNTKLSHYSYFGQKNPNYHLMFEIINKKMYSEKCKTKAVKLTKSDVKKKKNKTVFT